MAEAQPIPRDSISTTGWSTSCWPPASSPTRRSTTGTCRRRCRTAAAGNRATPPRRSASTPRYVAGRLTDRVRQVFTINEMQTFVEQGHETGNFAPGLKLPPGRLNQVRHHAVLAHGLAVQAVRASGRRGTRVGPAENIATALPAIETAENIKAAETRDARAERALSHGDDGGSLHRRLPREDGPRRATLHRRRTEDHRQQGRLRRPERLRAQPVCAGERSGAGFRPVPFPSSHPHMASTWLLLGPEALYWAPRHAARLWQVKDIFITENGASAADEPAPDGAVHDVDRVMYLRNCLMHLQRATADGVPVRGYFLWSLLDNFEWADGYANSFRPRACRLCDTEANSQAQRRLLSRGHRTQRAGMRTAANRGPQNGVDRRGPKIGFPFAVACETWKQFSRTKGSSANIRIPDVPAVPRWATL